jgi:aminoglycoside 3-N-acetyltransferase
MAASHDTLVALFKSAGIREGGTLLIHTSLSSLGPVEGGADTVIDALLTTLGPEGTLLIPTLSYLFVTSEQPVFDVKATPTNLGSIPSAALLRDDCHRSLHPTHSVASFGKKAVEIIARHGEDRTPVGPHSPFRLIRDYPGSQIAFLGCGARCNTAIHGVEERLATPPPYLLKPATQSIEYTVTGASGVAEKALHRRHDFAETGQRYERLRTMVPPEAYKATALSGGAPGKILEVFEAQALLDTAFDALTLDPSCLTEHCPKGEAHVLVECSHKGFFKYKVVAKPFYTIYNTDCFCTDGRKE